jgi:hypothetical protein
MARSGTGVPECPEDFHRCSDPHLGKEKPMELRQRMRDISKIPEMLEQSGNKILMLVGVVVIGIIVALLTSVVALAGSHGSH